MFGSVDDSQRFHHGISNDHHAFAFESGDDAPKQVDRSGSEQQSVVGETIPGRSHDISGGDFQSPRISILLSQGD